jgi:16S rRNA (guanine527-N7)-methyltransferase
MTATLAERLIERAASKAGFGLNSSQAEQIASYLELLARWNQTINLTALPLAGFPDETLDRAVMEPLAAAAHLPLAAGVWFDVGSGGGTPAIPLKIVRPALELTMVESRSRKAAFLREAVRTLGLSGAAVANERFELMDLAPNRGTAGLVTARAVQISHELVSFSAALLAAGGYILFFTSLTARSNADAERVLSGANSELQPVINAELPTPGAVLRILRKPMFHVEQIRQPE